MDTTDQLSDGYRPPDSMLEVGSLIDGRYEVRGFLGSGGSATVYEAWDRKARDEVAIKHVRTRGSDVQLARLQRELRVARSLDHPHIVKVYDIAESEEHLYLSMELVKGRTLRALLREREKLPVDDALEIASQIVDGLEALHEQQIVHRDLKPSNILLDEAGSVKIADLGLARVLDTTDTKVTETGTLLGTYEYLSPEQAAGHEIDLRSDLYQLGLLLYEMVVGQGPFKPMSSVGFVAAHLAEQPPRLRAIDRSVPRWLDRIVARLLEKHPAARYQTVGELRRDLDRRRARARIRRPRILAAVLLAFLGSGLTFSQWHSTRFEALVPVLPIGFKAIDRSGNTLWESDLPRSYAAPIRFGGKTYIVTTPRVGYDLDKTSMISLRSAQTGDVIETLSVYLSHPFPRFSDEFGVARLTPVDLDHDGNEELVLDYVHIYWPSFSVIWSPTTRQTSRVFAGSGHHYLCGTADLDGDGLDELIYSGLNNLMGYSVALAAVSPRIQTEAFRPHVAASSPDTLRKNAGASGQGLMWYALAGVDAVHDPRPIIDRKNRLIRVTRRDGSEAHYTFEGFERSSQSPLTPADRRSHRSRAYANLRAASRFEEARTPEKAQAPLRRALELTRAAGDSNLEQWILRRIGQNLIATGNHEEAENTIEKQLELTSYDADVHYSAAVAYHLAGHARQAVEHFRTGYATRAYDFARMSYEYVHGEAFALAELDQLSDLSTSIRLLEEEDPYLSSFIREWRVWIEGGVPRAPSMPVQGNWMYLHRYWIHEFRTLETNDLENHLHEARALGRTLKGLEPMTLSMEADILHRLGRNEEALRVSIRALDEMIERLDTERMVRGHARLIAERHQAIAAAVNDQEEARRAEHFLAGWGANNS